MNCFGSLDAMKEELSAKSIAVQGSGWGWLGYNTSTGTYYFVQESRGINYSVSLTLV